MISPSTNLKQSQEYLNYQSTILVILFIVTLPLNIFFFTPALLSVLAYVVLKLNYNNFIFIYNEKDIEISQGIINKSQKTIPYNTIQNINITSGWFQRRFFNLQTFEIWTSSPDQIQISQNEGEGSHAEHFAEGTIFLNTEDAQTLKDFIMSHK